MCVCVWRPCACARVKPPRAAVQGHASKVTGLCVVAGRFYSVGWDNTLRTGTIAGGAFTASVRLLLGTLVCLA
jgi:hypothetical protein